MPIIFTIKCCVLTTACHGTEAGVEFLITFMDA